MAGEGADCYFLYASLDLEGRYLARGSDGTLYVVPDQPGGWAARTSQHVRARLMAVERATQKVAELGGSVGDVHIASLDDDLTLPLREAALGCDLSPVTLRSACQRGRIPGAEPFGSREWAVPTRGLREYLANRYHPRPTRRGRPQPRRAQGSGEKG